MDGSTEVSGGNTPSGPTSFSEVSWSDASPASESSQQTTTPSAAEQPTAASESQTTPADEDRSPFIPRPRFDEVNTERNALKAWKEQYGWAEQVKREQIEQAVALSQRYTGDPIGFLQELAAELQQHPEHGAKLRSLAAKTLAQARGQQQTAPDTTLPDVQITDAQGNVVGTLSQILEAERKRWLSEVDERFQPVVQTVEQVHAERARLASESFASSAMETFSKLPDFDAHKAEIGQRLRAMNLQTDDPQVLTLAVKALYADVVTPKREQQLSSKAQSQLLDNLQQKAAASTSVNPGSAAPSTPKSYRSFSDLPADAWR